mmetsp:Transcript_1588/g.1745  ORF Transcript_1588/g.1745 Transcript_1588/m.1745 type:complete len:209 (-) Transcript_1588:31-657(-)
MVGGAETTSHSLMSCIFFLKKYPQCYQKLKKELNENGFIKGKQFKDNFNLGKIHELNYLACFIKEALRVDSVLSDTFDYVPLDDIQICGVPIAKRSCKIKVDVYSAHFDHNKWLDPLKFEPDRHNVESEFYKKSRDNGKMFDAYSRRTFSSGNRRCPGETFAIVEMKIIIAYLISHINFEFSEEDLNNEYIGFGIGTHFQPKIKIIKT